MTTKLIDLYNHLIKYNNDVVFIAFHSKTQDSYFHAKQICTLLKYNNYKKAIKII